MSPNTPPDVTTPRYKRHRFPAEIIAYAVWLYFRFSPSLRYVEDLLAERGIVPDRRGMGRKFCRDYARSIRRIRGEVLPTNGIWTKWSSLSSADSDEAAPLFRDDCAP